MDQDAVIYLAIKANNERARIFHRRLVEAIVPYFISNVSKNEYQQMQKQIRSQQEHIDLQDKLIEEAQPAIHMFDEATNDDSYITIKQIADNYGLTAQALNAELYKLNFHYPVRDGWVLYESYKNQGLVCTRKRKVDSGEYEFTIGYTEKGRNVIDKLLHNNGMKTRYEI